MKYEEVKELIAIFEKSDLNDMEVQLDNAVVKLNRNAASPVQGQNAVERNVIQDSVNNADIQNVQMTPEEAVVNSPVSDMEELSNGGGRFIKAPIVGTFYQSSAPDKPSYVKVGDSIAKGDVVCIIEAMKFMNEVNSEESGKITEILVKDGEFVEFGQPLFRVE